MQMFCAMVEHILSFRPICFVAFFPVSFLLAQEHNFEVEFVTYRWPSWLRRQKEKQRIIWGYKILFLDVLFPLRLSKVIFIDADQVRLDC